MITKQPFFEEYNFSKVRHLHPEHQNEYRQYTESIQPWFLKDIDIKVTQAVKKNDRNSQGQQIKRRNKSLSNRIKLFKNSYQLNKINPEIAVQAESSNRRQKTQTTYNSASSPFFLPKPFKQMKIKSTAKQFNDRHILPQHQTSQPKLPLKSLYVSMFKYKRFKMQETMMKDLIDTNEQNFNLNRYSLMTNCRQSTKQQLKSERIPFITKRNDIFLKKIPRPSKNLSLGLSKLSTYRKHSIKY